MLLTVRMGNEEMRKRLRKKTRLGEFREMGFEVHFRVSEAVSDVALDAFWDRFIGEAIEANGLACGGGCGREWSIFVTTDGRGSATEEQRALVERWLRQRGDVENVSVGALEDAWYAVGQEHSAGVADGAEGSGS